MITRKCWKKLLSFSMAVVCLLAVSVQTMAGEIDPGRTGSVSVTIRAYATDEVVGGGNLQLYQIAGTVVTSTGETAYRFTDSFAGCAEDLLTADELAKAETADVFSDWVGTHGLEADESVAVSAEGQAYFANLACGLYLVTQNEAAEGYHGINAFLVSVPLMEDGIWIYNVDATPKTSPVTKNTTEEPKEETGATRADTKNPDGTGTSGTTAGGGGRTGDISGFLYSALVIAAVLLIVVALRKRTNRRTQ